jgi:hypothetical protein
MTREEKVVKGGISVTDDEINGFKRHSFSIWFHPAEGSVFDISADCSEYRGWSPSELQYALRHQDRFPGFIPPIGASSYETPGKLALRQLAEFGWVKAAYIAFPNRGPGDLSITLQSATQLSEVCSAIAGLSSIPDQTRVHVTLMSGGSVPVTCMTELARGYIPDTDYSEEYAKNSRLNEILVKIKALPFSEHLYLMGSAPAGRVFPGDLDVAADVGAMVDAGFLQKDADRLLRLSSFRTRFYGLLDPFLILPDGKVLTRNGMGTDWVPVRNNTVMISAYTKAIGIAGLKPFRTGDDASVTLVVKPKPGLHTGPP